MLLPLSCKVAFSPLKVFTDRYFEARTLQFFAFESLFNRSQNLVVYFFQFENFLFRPWTLKKNQFFLKWIRGFVEVQISYYESVDDSSLSQAVSIKRTKKELMQQRVNPILLIFLAGIVVNNLFWFIDATLVNKNLVVRTYLTSSKRYSWHTGTVKSWIADFGNGEFYLIRTLTGYRERKICSIIGHCYWWGWPLSRTTACSGKRLAIC